MKHNIKNNAMKVLNYIYDNCDNLLSLKDLDLTCLFTNDFTKDDIARACEYLVQKGFITKDRQQKPIFKITTEITALGIDFVEEQHID